MSTAKKAAGRSSSLPDTTTAPGRAATGQRRHPRSSASRRSWPEALSACIGATSSAWASCRSTFPVGFDRNHLVRDGLETIDLEGLDALQVGDNAVRAVVRRGSERTSMELDCRIDSGQGNSRTCATAACFLASGAASWRSHARKGARARESADGTARPSQDRRHRSRVRSLADRFQVVGVRLGVSLSPTSPKPSRIILQRPESDSRRLHHPTARSAAPGSRRAAPCRLRAPSRARPW